MSDQTVTLNWDGGSGLLEGSEQPFRLLHLASTLKNNLAKLPIQKINHFTLKVAH